MVEGEPKSKLVTRMLPVKLPEHIWAAFDRTEAAEQKVGRTVMNWQTWMQKAIYEKLSFLLTDAVEELSRRSR